MCVISEKASSPLSRCGVTSREYRVILKHNKCYYTRVSFHIKVRLSSHKSIVVIDAAGRDSGHHSTSVTPWQGNSSTPLPGKEPFGTGLLPFLDHVTRNYFKTHPATRTHESWRESSQSQHFRHPATPAERPSFNFKRMSPELSCSTSVINRVTMAFSAELVEHLDRSRLLRMFTP
ncbi:unnamed protein product, partial [Ectocarpus sp. 12 AP-2014]